MIHNKPFPVTTLFTAEQEVRVDQGTIFPINEAMKGENIAPCSRFSLGSSG